VEKMSLGFKNPTCCAEPFLIFFIFLVHRTVDVPLAEEMGSQSDYLLSRIPGNTMSPALRT
jgi:hypothetical protein